MRKFFSFLFSLLIFFVIFLVGIYAGAVYFLNKYSRQGLENLVTRGETPGIESNRPGFRKVIIDSYNSATWKDVSIDINVLKGDDSASDRSFSIRIPDATITLKDFSKRKFIFSVRDMNITWHKSFNTSVDTSQLRRDNLENGKLELEFSLGSFEQAEILSQVRDVFHNSLDFIKHGRTATPITFSGTSKFTISNKVMKAKLQTAHEKGEYIIVMNKADLRSLAKELDLDGDLTEEEVDLLSRNPFRASRLLRIADYAKDTSKKKHNENPGLPQDAYRHVLWSYLLTKAYGDKFAKKVTDAHEAGDTGNTESQRKMDYNNNNVGRHYVDEGYSEASILWRIMRDGEIIFSPLEIAPGSAEQEEQREPQVDSQTTEEDDSQQNTLVDNDSDGSQEDSHQHHHESEEEAD